MRQVRLHSVNIKSFRSFLSEEVIMPESNGLRLLTGVNSCETRLGANGAGKSSFWKAVEWCSYGTSRISSCISWGQEKVDVVCCWQIGDGYYNIRRFGPPMKIEINGKEATQQQVDNLLGLDKLRFQNSVIFGQAAQLFPDKAINERGELLDQVLSLNIWQAASEKANESYSTLDKEFSDYVVKLAFTKGKLEALPRREVLSNLILNWDKSQNSKVENLQREEKEFSEKTRLAIDHHAKESEFWEKKNSEALADLAQQEEQWKSEVTEKAEQNIQEIHNLEAEQSLLEHQIISNPLGSPKLIEILLKRKEELSSSIQKSRELITKCKVELESCNKALTFWDQDSCPVCQQSISADKKKQELNLLADARAELAKRIGVTKSQLEEEENLLKSIVKQISELETQRIEEGHKNVEQINRVKAIKKRVEILETEAKKLIIQFEKNTPYTSQINLLRNETNPHPKEIERLTLQQNPYTDQIIKVQKEHNPYIIQAKEAEEERNIYTKQLEEQQKKIDEIKAAMNAVHYWKNGFKRIRLYFIQQILASLQIEVQAAVDALGLSGWKVKLATESLTKSETLKLGVQIIISSPTAEAEWTSWSGGEAQRLRRAIAIGVASLIQRAAGVYYPLEVWDEPTAGLSPEGVEDLLETLQYRSEVLEKQVWVVDHSALTYSGFNEIWCATKTSDLGSKLSVISREA